MNSPTVERSFSSRDPGAGGWRVAAGRHRTMVGESSRDIALTGEIARGGASGG